MTPHFATAPAAAATPRVTSVVIARTHRGQGLGRMLLHAAEALVFSQGFAWIGLSCWPPEKQFYLKLGFVVTTPPQNTALPNPLSDSNSPSVGGALSAAKLNTSYCFHSVTNYLTHASNKCLFDSFIV
jgi:hypothetical protein